MLKRSFAEFHAQKKLPENQQLLMRKLAQPRKSIEYVGNFCIGSNSVSVCVFHFCHLRTVYMLCLF